MMYATMTAPSGYSSAYCTGTSSAQYTTIQISSDTSVVPAAQVEPYTAQKSGGSTQHNARGHIKKGAARRTSGSGGNNNGTAHTPVFVPPPTDSPGVQDIPTAMKHA